LLILPVLYRWLNERNTTDEFIKSDSGIP
ncbi:MAG: hypothetical protein RR856_13975, partial [Acinetobacter sp.]